MQGVRFGRAAGGTDRIRDCGAGLDITRCADDMRAMRGEPIQLDYRLEKAGDGWKIYDVNVGGFWVVEAYKGQFSKDLAAGGLDALINRLAEKNKAKPAVKG